MLPTTPRPLLEGTLYKIHSQPRLGGSKGAVRFCEVNDYTNEFVYYASMKA